MKAKLNGLRDRYGGQVTDLREEWTQNILSIAFKAMGMSVTGTITVEDSEVRLVAQVPFAALIFKRLIEKTVRAELRGLLT